MDLRRRGVPVDHQTDSLSFELILGAGRRFQPFKAQAGQCFSMNWSIVAQVAHLLFRRLPVGSVDKSGRSRPRARGSATRDMVFHDRAATSCPRPRARPRFTHREDDDEDEKNCAACEDSTQY